MPEYTIEVEDLKIKVKQPNRHHLEEYFNKAPRNIMAANRNLLINIAHDPEEVKKQLEADPALAMSVAGALSELTGIKEAVLRKS